MSTYVTASVKIDSTSPELPREADFLRIWKGVVEPTIKWFDASSGLDAAGRPLYEMFQKTDSHCFPDFDAIVKGSGPELIHYNEAAVVDGVEITSNARQQTIIVLEAGRRLESVWDKIGIADNKECKGAVKEWYGSVNRVINWVFAGVRIDFRALLLGRLNSRDFELVPMMLDVDGLQEIFDELSPARDEVAMPLGQGNLQHACLTYALKTGSGSHQTDFDPGVIDVGLRRSGIPTQTN